MGTLDGANVEIKEEVGDRQHLIFGMNVEEVRRCAAQGIVLGLYHRDEELRAVIDGLQGHFARARRTVQPRAWQA